MAEEYERRRAVDDMVAGPLGEDGPGELSGEVRDRGLFSGRHGRRSDYEEADMYASELGGGYGRRPGGVMYDGEGGGYIGGGYGSRPPPGAMVYEGEGAYGGYEGRPMQPEVAYVGGGGYGSGYGGGSYGEGGYGRRPHVVYDEPVGGVSDLGTGLIDSNIRTEPDYGSSLTRPDLAGVPVGVYENLGHHGHHGRTEEEFEEERRHKRYAEAATAAALGYGLHERHEKNEAEERLEELGYDSDGRRRREHHLFRSDS